METNRTDQILRTLWDMSNAGEYSVRCYRLADRLGHTLTEQDVDAILASGVVEQITGSGGPSSFRMTVSLDDILSFETGEFYDADVERLTGALNP